MENKEHSWWAPVTNENSLFFHSFLILVGLSLSPHYKPQKHRTYQNIFHNSFWLFVLFNIREENEWQYKEINHRDSVGQNQHIHLKFSQCSFVSLFSFTFDPKTWKWREGSHMWLIIKKIVTAIPPQNIGITPLMICYIFLGQLHKWQVMEQNKEKM